MLNGVNNVDMLKILGSSVDAAVWIVRVQPASATADNVFEQDTDGSRGEFIDQTQRIDLLCLTQCVMYACCLSQV